MYIRGFKKNLLMLIQKFDKAEPMALGVSDVFPLAMFVHVDHSDDLKLHHLEGQRTVLLVDSVVNTGKKVLRDLKVSVIASQVKE